MDRVMEAMPPLASRPGNAIKATANVDDGASAGLDTRGNGEEGAEQIEFDGAPELRLRCFRNRSVRQGRTAGIVVEDVELAVVRNGFLDGGFDAGALGHVAVHEPGVAATVALVRVRTRLRPRRLSGQYRRR